MSASGFVPPSDQADASRPPLPLTASERLVASRALLRAAIVQRAAADALASSVDALAADAPPLEKLWRRWQAWRPFGLAGTLAARTADAVVRPIVQRHPVRMTLGAALAGGLLVWSRPWQWTLASALLAGWLPRHFAQKRTSAKGGAWLPLVSAIAVAIFRPHGDGARPDARASTPPNPACPPADPEPVAVHSAAA